MEKIKTILTKETKLENYLLAILSVTAVIIGILILSNVIAVSSQKELLDDNPNLFAWIIIIVGIIGGLISFFQIKSEKEEKNSKKDK